MRPPLFAGPSGFFFSSLEEEDGGEFGRATTGSERAELQQPGHAEGEFGRQM